MRICDIDLIENFDWLRDKKIILYGTGYWGQKVYEILKYFRLEPYRVVKTTASHDEMFEDRFPVEQISVIWREICSEEFVIIIASQPFGGEMLKHISTLVKGGGATLTFALCRLSPPLRCL